MHRGIEIGPSAKLPPKVGSMENQSSLFSGESVLALQKLIFAGSPLAEVLTKIAQLVEAVDFLAVLPKRC